MTDLQNSSSVISIDECKKRKDQLIEIVKEKGHNIVNYPLSFGIHRAVGPYEAAIYFSPREVRIVVSDEQHFDEAVALALEFEARTNVHYEVNKNYSN